MRIFHRWQKSIGRYAKRWWFAPLVAVLSAADAFLLVVPNEPILVAAVTARPKRWLSIGIWATVGSAVGAAVFAWLVSLGSGWLIGLFHLSKLRHTHTWIDSVKAIRRFGLWGLALVSLSPLPQHPAVLIAGLVQMSVLDVFIAVLLGRAPKYLGIAYLAAKAPKKLRKWHLISSKAA